MSKVFKLSKDVIKATSESKTSVLPFRCHSIKDVGVCKSKNLLELSKSFKLNTVSEVQILVGDYRDCIYYLKDKDIISYSRLEELRGVISRVVGKSVLPSTKGLNVYSASLIGSEARVLVNEINKYGVSSDRADKLEVLIKELKEKAGKRFDKDEFLSVWKKEDLYEENYDFSVLLNAILFQLCRAKAPKWLTEIEMPGDCRRPNSGLFLDRYDMAVCLKFIDVSEDFESIAYKCKLNFTPYDYTQEFSFVFDGKKFWEENKIRFLVNPNLKIHSKKIKDFISKGDLITVLSSFKMVVSSLVKNYPDVDFDELTLFLFANKNSCGVCNACGEEICDSEYSGKYGYVISLQ